MRVPDQVHILPGVDALAEEAARRYLTLAQTAVTERGRFAVALSGGSTPGALYHLLASPPHSARLPWTHMHLFWGDERCVPPEDSESSYRLVAETLLAGAPMPPGGIYRMRGEWEPERAAEDYERTLRAFFGAEPPRFDLVLLGLGKDGHTASLFPGAAPLAETERWCIPAVAHYEGRPSRRLTLTLPVLNAARAILFLVSGAEKAAIVRTVFEHPEARLPAQRVQPTAGEVTWLLDAAAGAGLRDEAPVG